MNKTELIKEVVYEMAGELTGEQMERLHVTLLVKMKDYEITQMQTMPSVIVYDNEWILKRFTIDAIAKGLHESSIKSYIGCIRTFFRDIGKNYREVTGQDITDYLAVKQYRDKISINYKATLSRYFSTFFKWAYKKRHIDHDIMRDVDSVRAVQKKKDRLNDEEIEDSRESCITLREKALFELMMSTGMRVGEISALDIPDLDLQKKRVTIYGEKSDKYRIGMLTPKAVKALRAYIAERDCCTGALFVSERAPYNRLQNASIEKIAKDIGKRAGVHTISTVHLYRKTFASVLYRKTKNLLLVSKLLGHADTAVTIQCYLIEDIDDMQYQYNAVS